MNDYGHEYKYDILKRQMRAKVRRKVPGKTKEQILNAAIHKLLTIKQQRIDEKYPPKRIRAVQTQVDILMKLKRELVLAGQFARWREKHSHE